MKSALDLLQQRLGNDWLQQNAPFPTLVRPQTPPVQWTDQAPDMTQLMQEAASYGPGSPFDRQMPSDVRDMVTFLNQHFATPQAPAPSSDTSPLNQLMARRQPAAMY
jgi:hypothetical protein